jgi:hypothetical protein
MPTFERQSTAGSDRIAFAPTELIMAGWTGRDRAAVEHHIAELAALGVPGPSRVPTFYRLDPALLAGPVPEIHVLGADTSGEVEAVLLALADGLWVGLGSDHTDRKMEAHGVALAKQLCRKPMAAALWRFDELLPHWDELILRAHIIEDSGRADAGSAGTGESGERTLYMEAPLAAVRRPEDLIRDYAAGLGRSGEPRLPVGTVMFMGAIGAIGGIRPASRFQMSLEDPVLGRTLTHAYAVCALPIVT